MQRIVDVRPNLVLVEKTVSRIAQDMLLEHGITLVINVKPVSVLHIYFMHWPFVLASLHQSQCSTFRYLYVVLSYLALVLYFILEFLYLNL